MKFMTKVIKVQDRTELSIKEREVAEGRCLVTRNGLIVWLKATTAKALADILMDPKRSKFITVEGNVINTVEVIGLFTRENVGKFLDEEAYLKFIAEN